jgi:hypothetical protein
MYASTVWHIASLGLQRALITYRELTKFSSHNFLLLTWKTKHHLNPPSLPTISPCKCHSSEAQCWLMVKPEASINSSLIKIAHTMEFKYTSSLHSSYLKPQTINMDVIPLGLLCLQKVSPVSKHAIFGQKCKISKYAYNLWFKLDKPTICLLIK